MENLAVNLVGVVVMTFLGIALGAMWYSPRLFRDRWLRCVGKTPEDLRNQPGPIIGSILANLLTAIGVSLVFYLADVQTFSVGLGVGFVLGVLIVFPALLSDNLFCGWGRELLWIQSGYRTLNVFMMAFVLSYLNIKI